MSPRITRMDAKGSNSYEHVTSTLLLPGNFGVLTKTDVVRAYSRDSRACSGNHFHFDLESRSMCRSEPLTTLACRTKVGHNGERPMEH